MEQISFGTMGEAAMKVTELLEANKKLVEENERLRGRLEQSRSITQELLERGKMAMTRAIDQIIECQEQDCGFRDHCQMVGKKSGTNVVKPILYSKISSRGRLVVVCESYYGPMKG